MDIQTFMQATLNKHIRLVQSNISTLMDDLQNRLIYHDKSKLESPEVQVFAATNVMDEDGPNIPKEARVAWQHHFLLNRHHPEHFNNDFSKMTINDVMEVFCDWMADVQAEEGDPHEFIEEMKTKYNLSDELTAIFQNTIEEYFEEE